MEANHLYDAILIDVSNLYHAAFATSGNLTAVMGDGSSMVTGGIFTTIKSVQKIAREHLSPHGMVMYICDASMRSSRDNLSDEPVLLRRKIDPSYKMNRKPHPNPSFYRGREITISILQMLRDHSYIIRCAGYEADDLVKPAIEYLCPKDARVLLVSQDEDWCRALSSRINVLKRNRGTEKIVTVESFIEENGYSPVGEGIKIYKSFRGDSDNVPIGVEGIREKDLVALIKRYGSLHEIRAHVMQTELVTDTWRVKIVENWPRVELNYRLVDFLPIDEETFKAGVYPASFQPKALRAQYDLLKFNVAQLDARVASDDYARIESKESNGSGFFIRRSVDRA